MLALKSILLASMCMGCRAVPANSLVADVKSFMPELASMKFNMVFGTASAVSLAMFNKLLTRPEPASFIAFPNVLVVLVAFLVALISFSMALTCSGLRVLLILSSSFSILM